MKQELTDFISDEKALRDILGYPGEMNIKKVIPILDKHCRTFIAHSPFLLIASCDGQYGCFAER